MDEPAVVLPLDLGGALSSQPPARPTDTVGIVDLEPK
jgi:hypothetical protein